MSRPSPSRMPVTAEQRSLMRRLRRCRFLPGSWDKRFVRDIQEQDSLTEAQAAALVRLGHRYRRQLAALVAADDRRLLAQADVAPTPPAGVGRDRWAEDNRQFNNLLMRGVLPAAPRVVSPRSDRS